MNTLICMGLLFSACLAFAMALPMASSELPVADVAVALEEETLQPAESRGRGGYGGYGGYGGGGYGGNFGRGGYGGGRGYGGGFGGGRGGYYGR